jgi:hypothetical protein
MPHSVFLTALVFAATALPLQAQDEAQPPETLAAVPAVRVRIGMTPDEVQGLAGKAISTATNWPSITTNRYRNGTGALEVDFTNDVAVEIRQVPLSRKDRPRKGLTVKQMKRLAGEPIASNRESQLLTNRYDWEGGILETQFMNGVLVAYRIISR